jgi:hypothetical protein
MGRQQARGQDVLRNFPSAQAMAFDRKVRIVLIIQWDLILSFPSSFLPSSAKDRQEIQIGNILLGKELGKETLRLIKI